MEGVDRIWYKPKLRCCRPRLVGCRQGERSITAFYNEIQSLSNQLAMVGDLSGSSRDKVMYFIDGLRDEFQSFVDAIISEQTLRLLEGGETILPIFLQQRLIQLTEAVHFPEGLKALLIKI